jgi:hypothetical protein
MSVVAMLIADISNSSAGKKEYFWTEGIQLIARVISNDLLDTLHRGVRQDLVKCFRVVSFPTSWRMPRYTASALITNERIMLVSACW